MKKDDIYARACVCVCVLPVMHFVDKTLVQGQDVTWEGCISLSRSLLLGRRRTRNSAGRW